MNHLIGNDQRIKRVKGSFGDILNQRCLEIYGEKDEKVRQS